MRTKVSQVIGSFFNAMSLNVLNDKSLLELGIGLALKAPLGVPSYHLTIGNLKHGNIQ